MTWQLIIVLQIVVSSIMTIFTRRLILTNNKVFFGVGVLSYITVACMGLFYALLLGDIALTVPSTEAWIYLVIEGLFIPAAWLTQYKLITHVGAGNAVIVTTLNVLGTALLGIIFLDELVTAPFVLGTTLILGGVTIALRLKPDSNHASTMSFRNKLLLTLLGAVLFAIGMFAEKMAITAIGVWDYSAYGWGMQAVGALALFALFGRGEVAHIDKSLLQKGVVLGLLTSVAGGLYIYALSMGTLSQTIVATSGKIVLVVLLAALFLKERNALGYKLAAFLLTACGIYLILG